MKHFNIHDDVQEINFHKIFEIMNQSSFWQYFNPNPNDSELHIYFDNMQKDERIIYTLLFNRASLNISRCTGFDGKKWTKGGNGSYKVANVKKVGRKNFDKFIREFSLQKYGYEFNQVVESI
jgi:hypothetical protein